MAVQLERHLQQFEKDIGVSVIHNTICVLGM